MRIGSTDLSPDGRTDRPTAPQNTVCCGLPPQLRPVHPWPAGCPCHTLPDQPGRDGLRRVQQDQTRPKISPGTATAISSNTDGIKDGNNWATGERRRQTPQTTPARTSDRAPDESPGATSTISPPPGRIVRFRRTGVHRTRSRTSGCLRLAGRRPRRLPEALDPHDVAVFLRPSTLIVTGRSCSRCCWAGCAPGRFAGCGWPTAIRAAARCGSPARATGNAPCRPTARLAHRRGPG